MAGGTVSITLRAVTGSFKEDMKESVKATKDWQQSMGNIGSSTGSVVNLGQAFGGVAKSISDGNIAGSVGGIIQSLVGVATVGPQISNAFKGFGLLLPALGPLGVGLGAVTVAATAVGGALLSARNEAEALNKARLDKVTSALNELKSAAQSMSDKVSAALGFDATAIRARKAYDEARTQLEEFAGAHTDLIGMADSELQAYAERMIGSINTQGFVWSADAETYLKMRQQFDEAKRVLESLTGSTEQLARTDAFKEKEESAKKHMADLEKIRSKIKEVNKEQAALSKEKYKLDFSYRTPAYEGFMGPQLPEAVGPQLPQDIATALNHAAYNLNTALAGRMDRIDDYTQETMGAIRSKMLSSGGAFVDDIDKGTTTLAGDIYNGLHESLGPGLAAKVAAIVPVLTDGLKASIGRTASGMVDSFGEVGEVMKAGIQGFTQGGGVWGAIIAVVTELLKKTPAFKDIVEMFNDLVGEIVMALNPLVEALKPLMGIITGLLSLVVDVLEPVFQGFAVVIQYVVNAIGFVVNAVLDIMAGAVGIFSGSKADKIRSKKMNVDWDANWDMNAGVAYGDEAQRLEAEKKRIIQDLVDEIKLVGAGFGDRKEVDSVIERARRAAVLIGSEDLTAAVEQYAAELEALVPVVPEKEKDKDLDGAAGKASDSLRDLANTSQEVSESLSNVPSGYKLALARFNAQDAGPEYTTTALATPAPAPQVSNVEIKQVTVVTEDPAKVWPEIKKTIERENMNRTGSPVVGTSPFYARRASAF